MKSGNSPRFQRISPSLAALALSVALCGCGGEDDSSSAPGEEYEPPNIHDVADADVPEIEVETPAAPAPIPGQAGPQEQPQNMAASVEADETAEDIQQAYNSGINAANDALESFYRDMGRFPKSMKELLDQGELTMAPRVPPGKKLIFSREERKFMFMDK